MLYKPFCFRFRSVLTKKYFFSGLLDAKNFLKNHRYEEGEDEANQSTTEMVMRKSVARRLIQDAKTAYTKPAIIKWSVWTALATCGNFQIGNYIQTLWHAIPSAQLLLVFTKVENILKGSLNSIPSPSPSVKNQIIGGKVYLR